MNDIITLSIYNHNSSASISKGSKIIAAFQEDRFVKKKRSGIPLNSIKACLKYLKIKAKDVDYIGIVNDTNSFKSKNSILNFYSKDNQDIH